MSGTEIAKPIMQEISFDVTTEAIGLLKEKYSGLVIIPDDKKSYNAVKDAAKQVRKLRTEVEKRRKELKADALEYGRKVDSTAKDITNLLTEIEDPLKEKKQIEDDRIQAIKEAEAKKEQERIDRINTELHRIQHLPVQLTAASLEELQKALNDLTLEDYSKGFDEFRAQAEMFRGESAKALQIRIDEKIESERIKKEQEELKKQIEKERLEREAKDKAEAEKREAKEKEEKAKREKEAEEKAAMQAKIDALEAEKALKEKAEQEAKILSEKPVVKIIEETSDEMTDEKLEDVEDKLVEKRVEEPSELGNEVLDKNLIESWFRVLALPMQHPPVFHSEKGKDLGGKASSMLVKAFNDAKNIIEKW